MREQLSIIPEQNRLINEIFIQKVLMTPSLAKKLLSTMVNNRNLNKNSLSKIIEDIETGQWVSNNGESIKINNEGRLMDGQHRLQAIINTNKPLEIYITFNCHINSINTVDTGAARTLYNVLKINNIKYYNTVGALIQSESVIIKGNSVRYISQSTSVKSYPRIVELAKENADYLNFVCKESDKLYKKFSLISFSFYAKYFNVLYKIDEDVCFSFFNQLADGIDAESPIYLLRKALINDSSKSIKKMSNVEKEALFIKCWNHYVNGTDLKSLRWAAGREDFPKLQRIEYLKNRFLLR